jgi:tRNA threonylcarbamoyladenosine biosynthesis protein TsaE
MQRMVLWQSTLHGVEATSAFAQRFFLAWNALGRPALRVYLRGPLGAGKSSFARALLRACGVMGAIKSPSYALIEPYQQSQELLLHVDLYRLKDPEEIIHIDLIEQIAQARLTLLEWPEQGGALLPPADIELAFDYGVSDTERTLKMLAHAGIGEQLAAQWA